jgi:hypothetical protein
MSFTPVSLPATYSFGFLNPCMQLCFHKWPKLTSPLEVIQAINGLKIGKTLDPNDIPKRSLRHYQNTLLPSSRKLYRMETCSRSIHCEVGEHPTLLSTYRPVSRSTPLASPSRCCSRSRTAGSEPAVGPSWWKSQLELERKEAELTDADFLDVAKAFDTRCVRSFL